MAVVPYANVSSAPSEEDFVVTGWLKYAPMTTRAATKRGRRGATATWGVLLRSVRRGRVCGTARGGVRRGENGIALKYSQRVARRRARDVEEDMSIGYAIY